MSIMVESYETRAGISPRLVQIDREGDVSMSRLDRETTSQELRGDPQKLALVWWIGRSNGVGVFCLLEYMVKKIGESYKSTEG